MQIKSALSWQMLWAFFITETYSKGIEALKEHLGKFFEANEWRREDYGNSASALDKPVANRSTRPSRAAMRLQKNTRHDAHHARLLITALPQ